MTDTILPAATVVLLRDNDEGPDVLLLRRSSRVDFAGGAWVFPGGRVDDTDFTDDDADRAARRASARETAEETGLTIDPGALVPFAHWTTPEGAPKRYATAFYATAIDGDTTVTVDGGEIADYRWCTPADAITSHLQGNMPMMPPTVITLLQLQHHDSADEALRHLAAREPEIFLPRVCLRDDAVCFLYSGDAGYETGDVDAPGPRHRCWMTEHCRYERTVS